MSGPPGDALAGDGFARGGRLDADDLAALRKAGAGLALPDDVAFHATNAHGSRAEAVAADSVVRRHAGALLADVLPGWRAFLGAYVVKGTSPNRVSLHQDWTYLDERGTRSYLAWIPLVDVDDANGALRFVPGSHRWSDGIRASGPAPPLVGDDDQDRVVGAAVTVPLAAGEAVVYDSAVVHGSAANGSGRLRPAIVVAVVPDGCPVLHFHHDGTGLHGAAVDDGFFTEHPFGSAPVGSPVEPWAPPVATATGAELEVLLSR